jgi:hypothetical protein
LGGGVFGSNCQCSFRCQLASKQGDKREAISLIVRNYTENTDLADQKEELSNKQRQKKHVCLIVPLLDFCVPIPSHRSHVPLCHKQKKKDDKIEISIVFKKNLSACLSGVTHHGTDAYLCGGK